MRTTIRKSLTTMATALALSAGGAAIDSGTAQASANAISTMASVRTSHCAGYLRGSYGDGQDYAQATFTVLNGAYNCLGWLERSTNGGHSWSVVSAIHWMAEGDTPYTTWYWDGPGYLARSCISESVAAPLQSAHCSSSW